MGKGTHVTNTLAFSRLITAESLLLVFKPTISLALEKHVFTFTWKGKKEA